MTNSESILSCLNYTQLLATRLNLISKQYQVDEVKNQTLQAGL